MILRAVYNGQARSRVELAAALGMTKPTVGDVTGELIAEGYLAEGGWGQSTDEGGKRPRLLEFQFDARQVIGVALHSDHLHGVLTNLAGQVLVEHLLDLNDARGETLLEALYAVIDGLLAQATTTLLCIGVGVPGLVESERGVVTLAPNLDWNDLPLAGLIEQRYELAAHIGSSTALAALGQYAFGNWNGQNGQSARVRSLAMISVSDTIGVGWVVDGNAYQGSIGYLKVAERAADDDTQGYLDALLGWPHVRERAIRLGLRRYDDKMGAEWSYLHLKRCILEGQPGSLTMYNELAGHLAQVMAWVIALLHPENLIIAGPIVELGRSFFDAVYSRVQRQLLPRLFSSVHLSLNNAPTLDALGAVAEALRRELGVI